MLPELWGPHLWKSVHYIALGYPDNPTENDMINYKIFYVNFWKIIPCMKCSMNYKRHSEELPIDDFLSSKNRLFEWTVHLHNIVNKELGKPLVQVESAYKIYTKVHKSRDLTVPIGSALVVVIILVCLAFYFSRKST